MYVIRKAHFFGVWPCMSLDHTIQIQEVVLAVRKLRIEQWINSQKQRSVSLISIVHTADQMWH
jgi:hypothetical protein